jgi:hypothetical protein
MSSWRRSLSLVGFKPVTQSSAAKEVVLAEKPLIGRFKPVTQSSAAKEVVLAEKHLIGRFSANQKSSTAKDIVLAEKPLFLVLVLSQPQ